MTTQNTAPSFAVGDGIVTTKIGSNSYGQSVKVQTDGKILVAGYSGDGFNNNSFALARYNSDGSLDTTFDTDGIVTTQVDSKSKGLSVTLQTDGKILVAGVSSKNTDLSHSSFALTRYNSDGSLDASFDNDGIVTTQVGSNSGGNSVTVQADGKILVAGYSDSNDRIGSSFTLTRYNPNGSLDASFDNDGIVTTTQIGLNKDGYSSSDGQSVAVQADSKILVAGYFANGQNNDFALTRYNLNGSLDTTFDSDGIVTTQIVNAYNASWGKSVTVQSDGKILVAGSDSYRFVLTRYNPNGSLDTTFDNDGIVTTQFGNYAGGNSVTVQADGKILVAGYGMPVGKTIAIILTRYNSDGSLDTTFDTDGIVTTQVGMNARGNSVTVQADGKILVAGSDGIGFVLARYNPDGSLDANFDPAVVSTDPNSAVVIDSVVNVIDAELSTQGNYNNAHLSLQRHSVSNSSDVFGTSSPVSFSNGILSYLGTSIGSVTQSNGKLDLTFNSNATQAVVTNTLRSLTYTNVSNGASEKITLDWTFSDGNTGSQGSGGVGTVTGSSVVNITDLTPPSVNNFSPMQSSINVALNSDIVLTFSEAIQRGTGNIVLKNSIGTVIATYDAATSSNLSIAANKLTINPSFDLAFSTSYIVDIANGSVKDLSGNVYSGTSSYQFVTATPNSLPTGSVSIAGNAKEGQFLTASNTLADADGLSAISYQWSNNGSVISGADKATYKLTSTDVGKTISVKASYTDLQGTSESANSEPTAAISSIKATKGNDLLLGTAKNNTLSALAGDDTLTGGFGSDKLTGGKGADTFTFTSIDDSGITTKSRDTITDFKHSEGDKIDLSGLGFSFIGNDAFSSTDATGQLRFDAKTYILYGSTNVDNSPEFSILLSGVKSLVADDLILSSQS